MVITFLAHLPLCLDVRIWPGGGVEVQDMAFWWQRRTFVFPLEQLLPSSNMPNQHSRLSASLQPTGQLHCGEKRQELKVANFVRNLFDLLLLPNTHAICSLARKAPREHGSGWFHHGGMEWVAGAFSNNYLSSRQFIESFPQYFRNNFFFLISRAVFSTIWCNTCMLSFLDCFHFI